ncbi:MAG: hypothetical protein AAFO91_03115 [Bacteroidota bacterium]
MALAWQGRRKIIVGGRGVGKTTYTGYEIYDCAGRMPRSLGRFSSSTYKMILTNIFPSAKKVFNSMGFIEDRKGQPGHYVIGRRPPRHFERPYNEALNHEYSMYFWNGSALSFVSEDRPDHARGGSFDYGIADEAQLMDRAFYERVLISTLRGNRRHFSKCHKHGMEIFVGSQPHSHAGKWVQELQYIRDELGGYELDAQGNRLKDEDTYFARISSYENLPVLGKRTLDLWKRSMQPHIFDIEIKAEEPKEMPDTFYPGFNAHIHTYKGGYEYDYDQQTEYGIYVKREDADRDHRLPLLLTFDFNGAQNSLLVAQELQRGSSRELRFLNEFYELGNASTAKWLKPFVDFYKHHKHKKVLMYGDPGGNKFERMEKVSAYDKIEQYLNSQGWEVQNMTKDRAYPDHMAKQEFINDILMEADPHLPIVRMHYLRCRWMVASVEQCPMTLDFKKDKSAERRSGDQRLAPHASDAFDYLIMYRYKYDTSTSASPGIYAGGYKIK